MDPIFRSFCCGKSPFDLFTQCRRQNIILNRASDRFADELDIAKLLFKLRDSYDFTKNMVNREFRSLMSFNKGRIIDPDESSDETSDVSTSEDEQHGNKTPSESTKHQSDKQDKSQIRFNDYVKLSVIRGVKMAPDKKQMIKNKIKKKEVMSIKDSIKQRALEMREKWKDQNTS